MKKANIEKSLDDLNSLILAGKSLEAFEKYYADEVIMQENETLPTIGKEANRQRELAFYSNIESPLRSELLGKAVADGISYATWHFDYTHKEWGARNYTQVSVQHWENGKIIREQFFYGN